jgi:hypothetical protein
MGPRLDLTRARIESMALLRLCSRSWHNAPRVAISDRPCNVVWGEIQDAASFALIDQVWTLPAKKQGGLTFLNEPLHFTVEMV